MKIHTVIVVDLICSKMQTGFREQSLRKTVSFKLVFIILQIVCNTLEKNVLNILLYAAWDFFFCMFPVPWNVINKKRFSFVTSTKTFFHLELDLKLRLIRVDVGLKIDEYHLVDILRYYQVLTGGYLVTCCI